MEFNGKVNFSCIGGLQKQIAIVKEIILFPLMYGEIYTKFNVKPPRGILFYGPPGTGKTLVASALANECSSADRKVSFISRKGSDCLSKYIGESEKTLLDIFKEAQDKKPCIIFFDEIDGLAPARSDRNEFLFTSIVSLLLSLMDGLQQNSEIIVIGATNRLESLDSALRRTGRFDRELYFPLPCYAARKEILSIYINRWKQKPVQKWISSLAAKTVGYCGSDLQALCTEAVMCCVRRIYPQIFNSKTKYNISDKVLKIEKQDFLTAQKNIAPTTHRITFSPIKCLAPKMRPLLQNNINNIMCRLEKICPLGMLSSDVILSGSPLESTNCPRLLLCGLDDCHTNYIAPAILHSLEHLPCHVIDITTLFGDSHRTAEEAIIQIVKEAKRTVPALLYVPNILSWWNLVNETARMVFVSLIKNLDRSVNILVFATATSTHEKLPSEIKSLYNKQHDEVYELSDFTDQEKSTYFQQLFKSFNTTEKEKNISRNSSIEILRKEEKRGKTESVSNHKVSLLNLRESRPIREATRKLKMTKVDSSISRFSSDMNKPLKRELSNSNNTIFAPQKRCKLFQQQSLRNLKECFCTKQQVKCILDKVLDISQNWRCSQLETLYAMLEHCLDTTESDLFETLQMKIHEFHEMEKNNIEIKEEHNMYI